LEEQQQSAATILIPLTDRNAESHSAFLRKLGCRVMATGAAFQGMRHNTLTFPEGTTLERTGETRSRARFSPTLSLDLVPIPSVHCCYLLINNMGENDESL